MAQWAALCPPGSSSGPPPGFCVGDCWAGHALWSSRSPELTFAVFEQWCPHLQMGDMISVTGVSRVGPGGAPGLQGALGSPFLLSWPQGYTARAGTCGS